MNRIATILLMLIFLVACKQNDTKSVTITKPKKEYALVLNTKAYTLQIVPILNSTSNVLEPKISLYKENKDTTKTADVVFSRIITLANLIGKTDKKNNYADAISLDAITHQYLLDKIVFLNFRASKLYFEARLEPKTEENPPLKVIFNLQSLPEKNYGELEVMAINHRDWKESKAFEENYTEQDFNNVKNCNILDGIYNKEEAQLEYKALLKDIRQMLSANSDTKAKHTITQDTLSVTETITFNNKTEYNKYKMPLKKLADVSKNGNKIALYIKWKDIEVNRFGYKPGKSGEFNITSKLSENNTNTLYEKLKRLSKINCFLKTL